MSRRTHVALILTAILSGLVGAVLGYGAARRTNARESGVPGVGPAERLSPAPAASPAAE